jgi:predicted NBD/HSP70 family sugar kinase
LAPRSKAVAPDLRRLNRGSVLQLLFLDGPLDRVRLGERTGLSSGTVTTFITSLIEEGLIVEVGYEQSGGGRPRALLEVNPEYGTVIGVEVGETGIRVEGFDLRLRVAGIADVALHPQHHDASVTIEEAARAVRNLKERFALEKRRLLGVGVGVPGMVEHRANDARVHAPIIGWHDVPVERMLRDEIGAPVFVENGAKALGQAEMWFGVGRGYRHAIVTLWGTGVGAAIFTDGSLYQGATSSAGEWGHTCIVAGGERCRCGSSGCVEAYIGARPLFDAWRRRDPDAMPHLDPDEEEWAKRLVEAAAGGGAAADALDEAARMFGIAAANLANLFNPEIIVIGGWLGLALGPAVINRIREVVREQALDYTASRVRIELGRFMDDAGALSACTLVINEMIASGGAFPNGSREKLESTLLR